MKAFSFSSVVALSIFSVAFSKIDSRCPEDGLKNTVDYVCSTIPHVSQVKKYAACLAKNGYNYQEAIDSCLKQKNNPSLSPINDPVSYHQFACEHPRMDDLLDFVCCLVFQQVPPGKDALTSMNNMTQDCVKEAKGAGN